MKNRIGTSVRDAQASRRAARKDGERDGARNYPARDPDGAGAADYESRAAQAEAETTDALTKASHFADERVDDDERLGRARAQTAYRTTRTKDDRVAFEDSLADQRAYEQKLPLSAKFGFWPRWVVYGLLCLLAVGSGAAVTAALLSVTTDNTLLSYVIGGSVAIATIVGGAALGSLLRRRDLDKIKDGKYASSGWYSIAVLILGTIGVLSLAIGVAGLRHAASEADAARRSEATKVDIFVPGAQNPSGNASAKATASVHGVDWSIWLLLEIGLAAAATSIEFQRSDIRAEEKERRAREVAARDEAWGTSHGELAEAVGEHEVAILTRADHDVAVSLTGNSQRSFANVVTADYRHGDLSVRGQGGADPFEALAADARLDVDRNLDSRPGTDARALGHTNLDEKKIVELVTTDRDLQLLQDAYRELGTAPGRPERVTTEPWVPGADLELDASAQALRVAGDSVGTPAHGDDQDGDDQIDTEVEVTTRSTDDDDLVSPGTNGGPK